MKAVSMEKALEVKPEADQLYDGIATINVVEFKDGYAFTIYYEEGHWPEDFNKEVPEEILGVGILAALG